MWRTSKSLDELRHFAQPQGKHNDGCSKSKDNKDFINKHFLAGRNDILDDCHAAWHSFNSNVPNSNVPGFLSQQGDCFDVGFYGGLVQLLHVCGVTEHNHGHGIYFFLAPETPRWRLRISRRDSIWEGSVRLCTSRFPDTGGSITLPSFRFSWWKCLSSSIYTPEVMTWTLPTSTPPATGGVPMSYHFDTGQKNFLLAEKKRSNILHQRFPMQVPNDIGDNDDDDDDDDDIEERTNACSAAAQSVSCNGPSTPQFLLWQQLQHHHQSTFAGQNIHNGKRADGPTEDHTRTAHYSTNHSYGWPDGENQRYRSFWEQ